MIDHWYLVPGFVALLAERVRDALAGFARRCAPSATVLFTAHSIPARLVDDGDPYAGAGGRVGPAIAEAGRDRRGWSVAWQSAGRTDDEWLGPDVARRHRGDRRRRRRRRWWCARWASCRTTSRSSTTWTSRPGPWPSVAGIAFARTASLNDDPDFCDVLADVVLDVGRGSAR